MMATLKRYLDDHFGERRRVVSVNRSEALENNLSG